MSSKGYKQTPEHIAKRKRFGKNNYAWKGNKVNVLGGRARARRENPVIRPCDKCGSKSVDRHHIDRNTLNNEQKNILHLCRKCHMEIDGRYERFKKNGALAFLGARKALMSKYKKQRTLLVCRNGHLWADGNIYIWKNKKLCKACRREGKAAWKARKQSDSLTR